MIAATRSRRGEGAVQVRVRLGAGLAGAAGMARVTVELGEGATVADLMERLGSAHPALRDGLGSALPVVAGAHAARERPLAGGDEVSLLLPAAGG
jgi:molybdopterin converting factor small subunit